MLANVSTHDEETAGRRGATAALRMARRDVKRALDQLYDLAPAYAGEVESVKESIDQAIRVLAGEAPE